MCGKWCAHASPYQQLGFAGLSNGRHVSLEARKHLQIRTRIEPHEVLVITFDEEGRPWRPSVVPQPCREGARFIMTASRLIDPARIRPDTKIPDLEEIVEANTERWLEGEDVLIETVHCSVNVTRDTDDHRAPYLT